MNWQELSLDCKVVLTFGRRAVSLFRTVPRCSVLSLGALELRCGKIVYTTSSLFGILPFLFQMTDFDIEDLKNILADQSLETLQNTVTDIKKLLAQSKLSSLVLPRLEPPLFSGKVEKNLEWIQAFERFTLLNSLTDDQKISLHPVYFRSLALSFYNETNTSQRQNPLIFDDWKTLLLTKFPIGRDAALRELELVQRVQKPSESVSDYAFSIRALIKAFYLTLPPQEREMIAKGAFLRGLRPVIKRFTLIGPDPTDLDEANKRATQQEIQSTLYGAQLTYLTHTSSLEQAINALTHDISTLKMSQSPTPVRFSPPQRPTGRGRATVGRAMVANTANRCWTCNRVGHYALSCPQKPVTPSNPQRCPVGRFGPFRGRGNRFPTVPRNPNNQSRIVGTLDNEPISFGFHPGLYDDLLVRGNQHTSEVLNIFHVVPTVDALVVPTLAELEAEWCALEALLCTTEQRKPAVPVVDTPPVETSDVSKPTIECNTKKVQTKSPGNAPKSISKNDIQPMKPKTSKIDLRFKLQKKKTSHNIFENVKIPFFIFIKMDFSYRPKTLLPTPILFLTFCQCAVPVYSTTIRSPIGILKIHKLTSIA